jgi:DNA invertase Pin-like site-specific DNA recombinase
MEGVNVREPEKEAVAVYSRKSKFTGKGESIENQIELCRQYIHTHFPNCTDESMMIYEDEGFSGGNTERPRFKKMMADARARKFTAIVCYRLDRISRNIGDFAKLIEELESQGIAFVSIKEQFDTSSPMGRAMMYISSVFSQLERETIAERIRDNMHELSKTGRWLGGNSPTGYVSEGVENVTIDGKVKKACRLKLIPVEAELVRQIFAKFLETNSLSKTETYFLQNGIKTKTGKKFTRFAIRNILTNPVYMVADADAYRYLTANEADLFADEAAFDGKHGVMAYNRTIQKAGKSNKLRPMNEWIVAVGKHEGLISGEDWIKAQGCLAQNRSKSYRKPRSNSALLSGLLFCAACGAYMRPKTTKRLDAHGELVFSYMCETKEKSRLHNCRIKNVNGNILDKAVCEEIKKLGGDSSEFIRQLELGKQKLIGNREEYEESLDRLRGSLAENEKEIAALVDSLSRASGTSAETYIVKQIEYLHQKGEALKHRVEDVESVTAGHALSDIEFDVIRQMLASFRDTLDSMDVEQKRAALRAFVKKVVWDGGNVHIYLFGSDGSLDLPQDDFTLNEGDGSEPPDNAAREDEGRHGTLGEDSKCYTNIAALYLKADLQRAGLPFLVSLLDFLDKFAPLFLVTGKFCDMPQNRFRMDGCNLFLQTNPILIGFRIMYDDVHTAPPSPLSAYSHDSSNLPNLRGRGYCFAFFKRRQINPRYFDPAMPQQLGSPPPGFQITASLRDETLVGFHRVSVPQPMEMQRPHGTDAWHPCGKT